MVDKLTNTLRIAVCAVLTMQLAGCGTLMYPERKGQKGGKIDTGVAILDGIGLLFFLIPGIIAFVVDFNNGTIYLPGGARASFDPKTASPESIAKAIKEKTGQEIALDQSGIQVTRLGSTDEIAVHFAKFTPANDTIALLDRK